VVEYNDIKDLYVLLMQFAFLEDWNTMAQRLCCERELLCVAASIGTKIVPVVPNFTDLGDYATCCKAPEYHEWLESMIKEIKELEKMGSSSSRLCPLAPNLSIAAGFTKFRDCHYNRHRARLVAMGVSTRIGA